MCPMTIGYETRETSAPGAMAKPWSCEKMALPIHAITREAGLGSGDVAGELAVVRFHCTSVACASREGKPYLTAMQSSWDDCLRPPRLLHRRFI
jgi:hypothetical protein